MKIIFTLLLILLRTASYPQSINPAKLKVFVDCKNVHCDNNFIRTEITLVDFVLDRVAADVHLLITSTRTGNGGRSLQYIFFGQNENEGHTDTLLSNISPNATPVELRSEVVKKLKRGLFAFISHSPYADLVDINMKGSSATATNGINEATKDKWNYWIFNVGTDGSYNADQVYKNTEISGHVSAHRNTEELKVGFSSNAGYNNATYTYEDRNGQKKNVVINSHYAIHHNLIKSITGNWSAGYEANYSNNTFSNNKRRLHGRAAVEYAIFPYADVNNKFFTLQYGVDVRQNNYYDTTIYNKISEVLWGHRLQAYLSLKQKWGNINSTLSYSSFLNDPRLNNLHGSLNVNVRITGGLSFSVHSRGGLVHDQVYLVRGKASEEDILVKRRQIASAYNFYTSIGLNFRFGSILNNFVNPRFDHP
jgi:hypothetical protein